MAPTEEPKGRVAVFRLARGRVLVADPLSGRDEFEQLWDARGNGLAQTGSTLSQGEGSRLGLLPACCRLSGERKMAAAGAGPARLKLVLHGQQWREEDVALRPDAAVRRLPRGASECAEPVPGLQQQRR